MEARARSSTFSSKFFLKLTGVIVILFVGYSFFLKLVKVPILVGQSQFQENLMKAEQFVFKPSDCTWVIVGSSLSDGLKPELFEPQICNLSFGGGSSSWGIELLLKSNKEVRTLLIETNVLLPVDDEFIGRVYGQPNFFLKSNSDLFLQSSQPATVLLNFLRNKAKPKPKSVTPEQFEIWLNATLEGYKEIPEQEKRKIENQMVELKRRLELLKQQDIELVFLEMPVDRQIFESTRNLWHRNRWHEIFPESEFRYLRPGQKQDLPTKDGLHLTEEALMEVAHQIQEKISI